LDVSSLSSMEDRAYQTRLRRATRENLATITLREEVQDYNVLFDSGDEGELFNMTADVRLDLDRRLRHEEEVARQTRVVKEVGEVGRKVAREIVKKS
jgi:hypothetical protein